MLYQLSYTPRPAGEVASRRAGRKVHLTIGRPIHVPSLPVNTFCVAAR